MNSDETVQVLKVLQASWHREITEDEAMVWTADLLTLDCSSTLEAVRLLREEQDFPPSHHQVISLSRSTSRKRQEETRELERPITDADRRVAAEGLRKLRKLAEKWRMPA